MKKILILTAKFGDDHHTAARNIRDAVNYLSDRARVAVVDLLESSYGSLYSLVRNTRRKVVQYAPRLWSGIYSFIDHSSVLDNHFSGWNKLAGELTRILDETKPDCVVSTYPVYGHVIQQQYRDHHELPFRLVTVITDSIAINSAWYRGGAGEFCVTNEEAAMVLRGAGIHDARIHGLGFPVSPFAPDEVPELPYPGPEEPKRVLYLINSGQKKAVKAIGRLLEIPDLRLTVTVERDAWLKAKLMERLRADRERVQILGWTNQMPSLLRSHHLVIGKAGGAVVQEAIAARCPIVINQLIPGQEEENAQLVRSLELGVVAESARQVADAVEQAFAQHARNWADWRNHMSALAKPDAALHIAELLLGEEPSVGPRLQPGKALPSYRSASAPPDPEHGDRARMLLCDFHIHTNYSDGELTLPEVVDFYGALGFDCICITDHLVDPSRVIGKLTRLCNFTLHPDQLDEYFEVIARERARAWRKYRMIVLAGLEFNKDGDTRKSSAHLLAIDLRYPIDPTLEIPELIARIREQGGLAVASHPHVTQSDWGKNTLCLWNQQEQFAPLLDAWEIANRESIFNPIGLKRLPFIANSDFHKPEHIDSWKTLLYCAKESEAIKQCIRANRDVAMTIFRKDEKSQSSRPFLDRKAAYDLPSLAVAGHGLPAPAALN